MSVAYVQGVDNVGQSAHMFMHARVSFYGVGSLLLYFTSIFPTPNKGGPGHHTENVRAINQSDEGV